MQERDLHDIDWIDDWIAQQREILARQTSGASTGEHDFSDFGRRWTEAGKTFFEGLRQYAPSESAIPADKLDPFNVGNAMLGAWTSATMAQSGFAEYVSELLRRLPPIGVAREQTEAWRELSAAHAECKRMEHELREVLAKVQVDALDLLEQRVRERGADAPIDNFRALYDLWVECGEQVYGKLAHSASYSKLQAELGNATMRLRSRLQAVIEHGLRQFDLPTRSEVNSLHRQVRELRLTIERLTYPPTPTAPPPRARTASAKRTPKAAKRTTKRTTKVRKS